MTVETLKKRAEFLRLRGGARCATPCFVLETRPRPEEPDGGRKKSVHGRAAAAETQSEQSGGHAGGHSGARFGYTVTKKIGGAVVRNRIRRRLRAAVGLVAPALARPNHDYVLIAREAALDRVFDELKKDLERALQRVHHPAAAQGKGRAR